MPANGKVIERLRTTLGEMLVTKVEPRAANTRISSLDGLRGIAALIVLIHHSLLTIPVLAAPYYSGSPAESGTIAWWMIHTPLHLLWEGKAAVYIFFILSGFVLTIPVVRSAGRYSWKSFYPHRLARLYLPVWGAVAFGALIFWALPRIGEPESLWLQERPQEMDVVGVIKSLTLVFGPGGLISPLWSLQWEILFSLAVPLYIWVAIRFSKLHWLILASCILVSTAGGVAAESILIYIPMFMIGVIIAVRLDSIRESTESWSNTKWAMIAGVGVILMCAHWIALAFSPAPQIIGSMVGLTLVGSAMIFVAAVAWRRFGNALSTPIPLWLGTVSFSVYLIHEPIVVGLGYLAGTDLWWSIPTGIIVSLAVGHIFYRVVELPSYKLAKRLRQPKS